MAPVGQGHLQREMLNKVYRLVGPGSTGATKANSTLAMGAHLRLVLPHIAAEANVRRTAICRHIADCRRRLQDMRRSSRRWMTFGNSCFEVRPLSTQSEPLSTHFQHKFKVLYLDKQSWVKNRRYLLSPADSFKTQAGQRRGLDLGPEYGAKEERRNYPSHCSLNFPGRVLMIIRSS